MKKPDLQCYIGQTLCGQLTFYNRGPASKLHSLSVALLNPLLGCISNYLLYVFLSFARNVPDFVFRRIVIIFIATRQSLSFLTDYKTLYYNYMLLFYD